MKFKSWEILKDNDSFGYFAQGFGYATADQTPFAGWLVNNKVDGEFKFIEVPPVKHKELRIEEINKIEEKVEHINSDKPMPPCCGVVEENFRSKPTGNKILDGECTYCDYKYKCWPELQFAPEAMSKAKDRKWKFYVELNNKGKEE